MRSVHSAARRLIRHGSLTAFVTASRGLTSHASCENGECRCTMPRALIQPRALPAPISLAGGSVFSQSGSFGGSLPLHATSTQKYQALIGPNLYLSHERSEANRLRDPDARDDRPHSH